MYRIKRYNIYSLSISATCVQTSCIIDSAYVIHTLYQLPMLYTYCSTSASLLHSSVVTAREKYELKIITRVLFFSHLAVKNLLQNRQ